MQTLVRWDGQHVRIEGKTFAVKRLVPCSTFKLVLAVAGLENGVIPSAKTVWSWNGEKVGRPEWWKEMDLAVALRESSEWYFREVARRLGAQPLQTIVQQLAYGSGWKGKRPEDAWTDGTLTITPLEQARFASRFALGTLPFRQEHLAVVRQSLTVPEARSQGLWGKTGSSAKAPDGTSLGWYVGAYQKQGKWIGFAGVKKAPGAFGAQMRKTIVAQLREGRL